MNIKIIAISGLIFSLTCLSCSDESEAPALPSTSFIYATFEDGSGFFIPDKPAPYDETITIPVDYHYPLESDNLTDMSRMRIRAYEPVAVSGASGVTDLTKPQQISITTADGVTRSHTVVGKVRKLSEAKILSFKLQSPDVEGWILNDKTTVGIVAGNMDVSHRQPLITVSPHATISPDPSQYQDFSKPVTYSVTAEDGTRVDWTIKAITPRKVPSGIRKNSAKLLWYKSLEELGLYGNIPPVTGDALAHLTTSISVSGDYLLVNTRTLADKYLNRFDGSIAGVLPTSAEHIGSLRNFFSATDQAGNILITNLSPNDNAGIIAGTLRIYKWKSVKDAAPVKFIEWKHDFSGSPSIGRKMSITGSIDNDALIFVCAGNTNATILVWKVKGGVLQSQTPEKISYPLTGQQIAWSQTCDVQAVSPDETANWFISGYGSIASRDNSTLVCYNPRTNTVIGNVPLSASGFCTPGSIDFAKFNKTSYLAAMTLNPEVVTNGMALLYNVTKPVALSTLPTDADYADVCVFKSSIIDCNTLFLNGNKTGDVALKVSDDGYKMHLYFLVTNAGIAAYEFDCIDTEHLMD
ncbi:MAG: DUF5018 domain-containing protein [Tannerella sp.]|jgi:hypothetical protein|nr:DUF5018 domain-containing protein [Tannerella sp.]